MLNVYPTYKDSGIEWLGQIPTHWELTRISSVLTEVKDLNTSLRFSHPSQFKFGDIILKPDVNIEDVSSLSKCIIFRKDDILINGLNLNYDFVTQRIARANYTGIITSAYIAVRVRNNLSSKYVTYLFKALDSRKVFNGLGTGIRLTLTYKELKKYYILLPPQEEQRQIVAYLDYKSNKINDRICQRERGLQTISELKQAEIATVVIRGLDPNVPMKESGIEWLGKIPAHWGMMRAKYMFNKEKRAVRTNDKVVTCFRDGQVTLRENRRISGFTESLTETGYQGVRKGDLVIHQMDAFAGAIGVSDSDGKGTSVYHCCTPKGNYSPHYYAHLIREMARSGYIESLYRGIRERSSDFNYDTFSKQYLPIPPREEQDAIVSYLQSRITFIDNYIAKLKEEINYLQEYKQRLVSDVVTGKVDVRGVEIPNEE